MRRHWLIAAVLVGVTACTVEPTPASYVDHGDAVARDRQAAAEEIQDHVLAAGEAMGRGSDVEALTALAPSSDAYIILPTSDERLTGPDEIGAALRRLSRENAEVQVGDVQVSVAPLAGTAWFRAALHVAAGPAAGVDLRATGVYVRTEGVWQLVQGHLSAPLTARDSSSNPASGSAPAGGG